MRFKAILLGTIASAFSLPAAPAVAQDRPEADPGDIIVTARKRQESIMQVPVVQTVLTEEMLERAQVTNLTDIQTFTTGLQLGQNTAETGSQISLRGVGTSQFDPGLDQSVSLNLDGLQLSQGNAYRSALFDMAQVEVLKGPQALFYGKSSPGGVVSIRTADPGDEVEVMGRIGYEGEAKQWQGEAVISAPLSDAVGVRLSAMYSDSDSFFRNKAVARPGTGAQTPSKNWGHTTALYLRGTVVVKPTDTFSAKLKLNYTRDRLNGSVPFQMASCPDGTGAYAGLPFFGLGEDCKIDRTLYMISPDPSGFALVRNGGREFMRMNQKFGTLELNYDITPEVQITSVSGYYKVDVNSLFNGSFAGYTGPAFAADKVFARREVTEEIRINSNFSGPLNFSAGGFYQDGKMSDLIKLYGNTLLGLPETVRRGDHFVDIKSVSLFGQLRYKPVDQLEIAAGARWTDEKRSDKPITYLGADIVYPQVPKLSTKNWSPELTLTYTPTNDLTIFGSLKQGYKSGSYTFTHVAVGSDNSFGDEKVQGGEIGVKAQLADRQIFANAATYYYKYKGLQVGASETPTDGVPIFRTLNAGAAKVYGVEFDMTYRPRAIEGLDFHAAGNWNHARFTEFDKAVCYGGQTIADGCDQALNAGTGRFTSQDLAGTPLVRAPKWTANFGVNYEMPAGKDMKVNLGLNGQYTSKYLRLLGRRPDFYQDAATKFNANVSLKGPEDAWEVAFIANNFTNKLTAGTCLNANFAGGSVLPGVITGAENRGTAGIDEIACAVDRGRELWLRLTLRPMRL